VVAVSSLFSSSPDAMGRRAGSRALAKEPRSFFGVSADPSLEEIQGVAQYYPVFRIARG